MMKNYTKSICIAVVLLCQTQFIQAQDNLTVSADTYVRGGTNEDTNYDGDIELKESDSNNDKFTRRVLLKFDLSGYSSITSAILHIYANQASGDPFTVEVFKVDNDNDDWKEDEVTWANYTAPEVGASTSDTDSKEGFLDGDVGTFTTLGASTEYSDLTLDVTDYLQEELTGDTEKIASLYLRGQSVGKTLLIDSKEKDGGQPAYLTIEGVTLGTEYVVKSAFSLYPNPAQNSFEIQTPNVDISNVKVFSINGSMLYNVNSVNSKSLTVDTSAFQTGVYFVHVKNALGALSVQKIIKN